MIETIPADLAQFYGHVLVSAQKLGYIYGWPDLLDENQNVTEGTRNVLTFFVGVMFGTQTTTKAITEISKNTAVQITKRLPQKALTKTTYYPVVKELGKWIGLKVTKDTFSKGVGKVIPILEGVISGGITYASFNSMSKKLHKHLQEEMKYQKPWQTYSFADEFSHQSAECYTENIDSSPKSELNSNVEDNLEFLKLKFCINMAKIDFKLDEAEIEFLSELIDNSSISENEKLNLLQSLSNKEIFDVDLKSIANNNLYAIALLENLAEIAHVDKILKTSEKIYFYKVAADLGFSKDQVSELLDNN